MSATNLTKNLKLPQFVASDKPSWLGDVNGAMKNIDDGIGVIKGDITKASDTASSAKSQSDANAVTLGNVNTELESIGNRVTALEAGGGTEQLEQRVNTLGTDVEALQTRADTFEEEIAQNGTNITNATKSITELTPRVKANEDGIKRLDTTTNGMLETLNTFNDDLTRHGSQIGTNTENITKTQNKADSAYSIANTANTNANEALNKVNSITTLEVFTASTSSTSACPSLAIVKNTSTKSLTITPITFLTKLQGTSDNIIATFTLDKTYSFINASSAFTFPLQFTLISNFSNISASAYFTSAGDQLTLHIKGTTDYVANGLASIGAITLNYN